VSEREEGLMDYVLARDSGHVNIYIHVPNLAKILAKKSELFPVGRNRISSFIVFIYSIANSKQPRFHECDC